jgi:hypothetical protein
MREIRRTDEELATQNICTVTIQIAAAAGKGCDSSNTQWCQHQERQLQQQCTCIVGSGWTTNAVSEGATMFA